MACFFLSDGGPDAQGYHNNYFHYDESSADAVARITALLRSGDTTDQTVRALLRRICVESFRRKGAKSGNRSVILWFSKPLRHFRRRIDHAPFYGWDSD